MTSKSAILLLILFAVWPRSGKAAASTDGTVTLNVTFGDPAGNYSARVDAFWVTDGAGQFIQNLRKDAGTRQQYLYQWAAARKTTVIDGYSGATISTWTPVTVTWDCRDTNNQVVPDGTYKLYVEFTDRNGQGPWTTNGLAFAKGLTGASLNYPDQTYLKSMRLVYAPLLAYDIAVTDVLPAVAAVGALVPVTIAVTNKTSVPETFTVTLSNVTSGVVIGSESVELLAGNASTQLTLAWNTAGLDVGDYTLVARASAVPNETLLSDNTYSRTITLRHPVRDVAIAAIAAPAEVLAEGLTNIAVTVTNKGDVTETLAVRLLDDTDLRGIGTHEVAGLGPQAAVTTVFPWSTTNATWGLHVLRAVADLVAGETSTADNSLTATSAVSPALFTNVYLTKSNVWRYHDRGVDLGSAWRETHYNDSAWSSGRGPLGYDDPPLNTPLSFGANASLKHPTYYFRAGFNVTNLPNALILRLRRDDGAAVYVNGAEVYRTNLAAGVILYTNLALEAVSGANETTYFETRVAATNLVLGTNLVAVEVHQRSRDSSDLSFDLEVLGIEPPYRPPMATNLFIARGSVWRYSDGGVDLGSLPWRAMDFYDGAWSSGPGPFGYGQPVTTTNRFGADPNHKHPTLYYRTTFTVDAPPTSLRLRLRRDDGAVVYHNGVEVYRVNLADGPVPYASWASAAVEGADALEYFETAIAVTNTVVGWNVLAVEVHAVEPADSDLCFDVELVGIGPLTTPVHNLSVLAVEPVADALIGDRLPVAVTVTNRGNVSDTATVFLSDTSTDQIVASAVIEAVPVGGVSTVGLEWNTLGAAPGGHELIAFTVQNGVTNLLGTAAARTTLSGTGIGPKPTRISGSLGGHCGAVAFLENRWLVGVGATLEVWDARDPGAPVRTGEVRLPGSIESIAATGTFAYVACGSAGVHFVDLTAPFAPVHVTTYDTSGHARGVGVSGPLLLIADGAAGLRIVNVADPASPWLQGVYPTRGPARAVAAEQSRAYLVDAHEGLLVLDLSNPGAPSLLGKVAFHAGEAIAVADGMACVVDGNNHVFMIDAHVPTAPVLAGSRVLESAVGRSVILNGRHAYVSALDAGLLVLDVGDPAAITRVRDVPVPAPGQSLSSALSGTTLVLANGFAGFQVHDVTTPGDPVLRADMPVAIRACGVAIGGAMACVAAGENGLRLYDLTDPAAPVWVGWLTNALNARCVALAGDIAVVGDGPHGLKLVRVADPAAPVLLGSWSGAGLGSLRNVGVTGSQAVACDGHRLGLFDLSTPGNPTLVALETAPAFVFDMAVDASRVYLACGNAGLIIVEIGPQGLRQASLYDSPGFATGVSVAGSTVYLADGPGGWKVLDVSGAVPVLVQSGLGEGPVRDVSAAGVLVALGDGLNRATILDFTVPLTPVPRHSLDALVRALNVNADGDHLFVAEDDAGMAIATLWPDVDGDGLPDDWERQIIDADSEDDLRTVQDVDAAGDFDGDGLTNGAEFIAGTGPADSRSRFAVQIPPATEGGLRVLEWRSVAGRTYAVHKAVRLPSGFVVVQDNIPATPPLNTFTDSTPGAAAFYIISVR